MTLKCACSLKIPGYLSELRYTDVVAFFRYPVRPDIAQSVQGIARGFLGNEHLRWSEGFLQHLYKAQPSIYLAKVIRSVETTCHSY